MTATFFRKGRVVVAEYRTSQRHSYLNVWIDNEQIAKTEMFHHVPAYETFDGLVQAAEAAITAIEN